MRAPDVFDRLAADEYPEPRMERVARCRRCGSTDVRWRQQGGRWVLFSLKPGVEHASECEAEQGDADDFDEVAP